MVCVRDKHDKLLSVMPGSGISVYLLVCLGFLVNDHEIPVFLDDLQRVRAVPDTLRLNHELASWNLQHATKESPLSAKPNWAWPSRTLAQHLLFLSHSTHLILSFSSPDHQLKSSSAAILVTVKLATPMSVSRPMCQ